MSSSEPPVPPNQRRHERPPPEAAYAKKGYASKPAADPPTVNLTPQLSPSRVRCYALGTNRYPNCRPETACSICVKYPPGCDPADTTPTAHFPRLPAATTRPPTLQHPLPPRPLLPQPPLQSRRKVSRLAVAIGIIAVLLLTGVALMILWANGVFGPIGNL